MRSGYILVFLAAAMWGTLGIFARLLYSFNLDTYTIVFYRVLFALILLAIYLKLLGLPLLASKRRLPFYAAYGFFSVFLFYSLYFYTVKVSSVSFAVLMLYTAPAYSIVLGRLLFGEPLTSRKIAAFLSVLSGVFMLNAGGLEFSPIAIAAGLASGLTYALYGVFAKFAVRHEEPERVLFNTLLLGLPFLLPFTDPRVPMGALPYLLALAFFPTFLGYILYNRALKEVEVGRASIIATVEPVIAMALAFLIFGESLGPSQIAGGALIILGSLLARH
ncbi:EamA family transporter [Pyrococcus yayanosii]|uniref:Drug/Metabolite transporter, putative n=1 Tax=Pyrococcus yayanosii (strain CH1 / JCM 16557) TaxID=529709 RepID=F8AEE9_PYRYC|nr:EamA family transporter [Pyrococcus yayanosii]AEH25392.1 Drug/Metabolite transporter, putative [Pyrococcus yayanosii CH1]